jgi:predicted peptidase
MVVGVRLAGSGLMQNQTRAAHRLLSILTALSLALLFGAGCGAEDEWVDEDGYSETDDALDAAYVVGVDFGMAVTASPATWNDARALVRSGTLGALKTTGGMTTPYSMVVTSGWNNVHPYGTKIASAGLGYPVAATQDGVYGNPLPYGGYSAPRATMEIRNLNPNVSYSFKHFASVKKGDTYNRDTVYRLVGATTVSGHMNPTNNDTLTVTLATKPNVAGTIRLEVEKGPSNDTSAGFYHLASFKMSYSLPVPYGVQTPRTITNTFYGEAPPKGYYEYLPGLYDADPNKKWPLIIALHGIGECGNGGSDLGKIPNTGLPRLIKDGTFPAHDKFIVLSPQDMESSTYMNPAKVTAFLDYAKRHYRIDTRRMYLTGLSYGGRSTWDYINEKGSSSEFAAALTAPGDGSFDTFNCAKAGQTPMWAFQGALDTNYFTSPAHVKTAILGINACATPPLKPAKLTIYTSVAHYAWMPTYSGSGMSLATDPAFSPFNVDIYTWMLGNVKP